MSRVEMHGTITGYNADAEARLAKALEGVAEHIVHDAGEFNGSAKVVVKAEDGSTVTLLLNDPSKGVERQGTMDPCEKVHFDYSFDVGDVEEHPLGHTMFHELDDTGLDYEMDEDSKHFVHHHDGDHEHGHHDHGHGCGCGHDHHDHDHEHHHEHGEECHCHDHHHDHDHEHHHEPTSMEQAGGCAVGIQGSITGYNADAEARFAEALVSIGRWVESESGCLLGHIKAAIVDEQGRGITLNLTDLENGVEHHGTLGPCEKVHFDFMCAVLDVDEHELKHRMFHAVDDTGLDYELNEEVECHCHDHHHDHDHGHGCECGHDHGHKHEEGCDCPECKAKEEPAKKEKVSFLDRLRRKKK